MLDNDTTNAATSLFGWPIELVSGLISAIIGFLTGLLGINYQRWLDRRGRIECNIEDLQVNLTHFSLDDNELAVIKAVSSVDDATDIEFKFDCVLRNHKNIDVEVREPRLIFKPRGKVRIEDKLHGAAIKGSMSYAREDIRFILLTKGQTKTLQLEGRIQASKYLDIHQVATTCEVVFTYGNNKLVKSAISLL